MGTLPTVQSTTRLYVVVHSFISNLEENLGLEKIKGQMCVGLITRKRKRENIEKLDIEIHTQETSNENARSYPLSDRSYSGLDSIIYERMTPYQSGTFNFFSKFMQMLSLSR